MDLLELVRKRRDGYVFTGKPLTEEELSRILEIARLAPCRWGGDPLEFIVVRNKDLIRQLARSKSMGTGPLQFCDTALIPIIDLSQSRLWKEDLSVVSTYVMLAAEELGIGFNWIHMDGRMGPDGSGESAVDAMRRLLDIPDGYGVMNILALGHVRKLHLEQGE